MVNVNSYKRSDGTRVRQHKRRKPKTDLKFSKKDMKNYSEMKKQSIDDSYKLKWKKVSSYKWKRKNDDIELIKNMNKSNDKVLSYDVEIYLFDKDFKRYNFKTEKEALKYINKYIKKDIVFTL